METEDKVEKRLRQTDANSKVAVTFALAQCKLHYTTDKMVELRRRYRPEKKRSTLLKGKCTSTVTWSRRRNTRARGARVTKKRF